MTPDGTEKGTEVSRRSLMAGAAAVGVAAAAVPFATSASAVHNSGDAPASTEKPNILIILVDEMRFPKVFPKGVKTAGEFLQKYMPNTYQLWRKGVKFSQHYSNANDCTPSRGVFMTGLYGHQTWVTTTLVGSPLDEKASSPVLDRRFPTYGKLMRRAGYQTPYVGKWHLSIPHKDPNYPGGGYLEAYGFNSDTSPDPIAYNLQGTYGDPPNYLSDKQIAEMSAAWLKKTRPSDQPWCLTVGFQNPHDKEFFPAGTEWVTWDGIFADPAMNPNALTPYMDYAQQPTSAGVTWAANKLKSPPNYGYPEIPPNWESYEQLGKNKPSYHQVAVKFQALAFGGVTMDPTQTKYTLEQYPPHPDGTPNPHAIVSGPWSYWQRSLDSYTQIMEDLDVRVGEVVGALPNDVAKNTIIIFTSDHGDFAGAHGMVSGKTGTVYDEVIRVPLIFVDPSGRYTGDIDTVRTGMSAHVDFLPMLVSIGHGGNWSWMKGDLKALYGTRHDLLPMLKSAKAPGRKYVVHSCDEVITPTGNFLSAPWHVTGLITPRGKLGLYSFWDAGTATLNVESQQTEYYDYSTEGGRLEIENTANSAAARRANRLLQTTLIPTQLRRPMPPRYVPVEMDARKTDLAFYALATGTVGKG